MRHTERMVHLELTRKDISSKDVEYAEWLISKYMPLAGGAINNFIPQIWSARILEALRKALVFAQQNIVNRDYEGEIQAAGDTVKINTIGDPTIFDYTKNTDM